MPGTYGHSPGQNVQADAADKRAEATFHDASATLREVAHVQGHLAARDELLTRIAAKIGLDPVPVIDNPDLDETANPDPGCWQPDRFSLKVVSYSSSQSGSAVHVTQSPRYGGVPFPGRGPVFHLIRGMELGSRRGGMVLGSRT